MVDLKAEVKRTPRRAPAPREYDPEYDQYMHMTGFYVIVHDAMRQQSWRAAGLRATGRVRAPTISYVPPPCAMMFLNDLCETLSVDYRVIDKRGATGASSARGLGECHQGRVLAGAFRSGRHSVDPLLMASYAPSIQFVNDSS
jgi:hypothetical protein